MTESLLSGCGGEKKISKTFFALDTFIEITVYDTEDEAVLEGAEKLVKGYEFLNDDVSDNEEYVKLTERALKYCSMTDGLFDITIRPVKNLWNFDSKEGELPSDEDIKEALELVNYKDVSIVDGKIAFARKGMAIDLGAIAKGYVADRVKEYLLDAGVKKALINLGGNIQCIGGEFNIGVKDPNDKNNVAEVVRCTDRSVVTSGTYERYIICDGKKYHHILDTGTGYPAETDLLSATVICASSEEADALSTICLMLGRDRADELIKSLDGVEVVLLDE